MHSEKLSTELKMLTSTMQFTSNEHTQPSSPPITPPPARDPLRGTVMKDCHAFGEKLFQASDPSSRPTDPKTRGPLPQDPTVHPQPHPGIESQPMFHP
ncbi:hypothetical protein J2S57_005874 [Kineosporia succinea]|uniref:Uncharacterized protein n=1 Tax=Kineosporia succinea TaxID=84632 RepID=A0ABT9PBQ4_9ACTN|nr:hypothetical protein [Kineosporia succinea]